MTSRHDVMQEAERLGLTASLPAHEGSAHNALDDARWTRDAYDYLITRRDIIET